MMQDFYFYIIQVNLALLVFYLLYRLSFNQDTFLGIRRLFLWTILFLAFGYPMINFTLWPEEPTSLQMVMVNYTGLLTVAVSAITPVKEVSFWNWQHIIAMLWGVGSLILFMKILIQLFQVGRMVLFGRKMKWKGHQLVILPKGDVPFSFFKWIFINPTQYNDKELEEIITHEQAHVCQWHSLDILMSEWLGICFWFNPVVWLLRIEIRQNLEFLADQKVVCSGYNRKNYQYHLLRLSHQSTAVQIVNNFNVSSLKKRIIMMNKKRTSKAGLIKYALLLPVTSLLILSANANVVSERLERTLVNTVQDIVVKGRVSDINNNPLAGVSVILKDSNIGVTTGENGEYSITLSEPGTLCFSYVGKKTMEIGYTKDTKKLNVQLPEDSKMLDKVVVTGYRMTTKKNAEMGVGATAETFRPVEEMPVFPEGDIMDYLAKNLKYPAIAVEHGIHGTVHVFFIVDKEGKVTNVKVEKSVDPSLDKEAVRVIQAMPGWTPGKQRGKAVSVSYIIPVEFKQKSL